jgi:hypothetical protein
MMLSLSFITASIAMAWSHIKPASAGATRNSRGDVDSNGRKTLCLKGRGILGSQFCSY